jgi:hypothetical protein
MQARPSLRRLFRGAVFHLVITTFHPVCVVCQTHRVLPSFFGNSAAHLDGEFYSPLSPCRRQRGSRDTIHAGKHWQDNKTLDVGGYRFGVFSYTRKPPLRINPRRSRLSEIVRNLYDPQSALPRVPGA